MEELIKKLKIDYEYLTGFKFLGLFKNIGVAFASRLKEFDDKLEFIKKNAFVSTADKDYLYLHASDMLPPEPALIASGLVNCYGLNGFVIPKNTEIKDDAGTVKTISDGTIESVSLSGTINIADGVATLEEENQLTNTTALIDGVEKDIMVVDGNTITFDAQGFTQGQSVTLVVSVATIQVVALESGVAQNRTLNTEMKIKKTIEGVNTDCAALQIEGGKDAEDEEAYRQRVKEFIGNPQASFSKPNIIFENKKRQQSLKYVWIKGGEYVEGEVLVVALNKEYNLTSFEIEQITKNTQAIAPANFNENAVSVDMPIVEEFTIVISDFLPTSESLRNEVKKNLLYYYDKDNYEKDITEAEIEAVIYGTSSNGEKPEGFTLVSGSKTKQTNTFYRLTDVIFQ